MSKMKQRNKTKSVNSIYKVKPTRLRDANNNFSYQNC